MASEIIYIVAPASMWGSVGYEKFYCLLAHAYPADEIFEGRFRPDMLDKADTIVVRPCADGSVPKPTWGIIEQARQLKKRIMLARIFQGSRLSLASLERYDILIDEHDDEHYARFQKRSAPEGLAEKKWTVGAKLK